MSTIPTNPVLGISLPGIVDPEVGFLCVDQQKHFVLGYKCHGIILVAVALETWLCSVGNEAEAGTVLGRAGVDASLRAWVQGVTVRDGLFVEGGRQYEVVDARGCLQYKSAVLGCNNGGAATSEVGKIDVGTLAGRVAGTHLDSHHVGGNEVTAGNVLAAQSVLDVQR